MVSPNFLNKVLEHSLNDFGTGLDIIIVENSSTFTNWDLFKDALKYKQRNAAHSSSKSNNELSASKTPIFTTYEHYSLK